MASSSQYSLSRYSPLTSRFRRYRRAVAYTSTRRGNPEISVIRRREVERTRVTNLEAADTDPTWAPDRLRLALASTRDGDSNIYTIGLDGSDPRPVTDYEAVDTDPP